MIHKHSIVHKQCVLHKQSVVDMREIALKTIRFYQYAISPHFPACCRYMPSCSNYAYDAVKKYGIWKGVFMALRRLLRCHPLHPGGYDPIL